MINVRFLCLNTMSRTSRTWQALNFGNGCHVHFSGGPRGPKNWINVPKLSLFPRLTPGSAFYRGAHQASLMSGFGV